MRQKVEGVSQKYGGTRITKEIGRKQKEKKKHKERKWCEKVDKENNKLKRERKQR